VLEEAHGICAVAVPVFLKIRWWRDLDVAVFWTAYGSIDESHCALPYRGLTWKSPDGKSVAFVGPVDWEVSDQRTSL
jgi:hypothetical protein